MPKVLNVRLREGIVKMAPEITSSLGNDYLETFLLMKDLVDRELEAIDPDNKFRPVLRETIRNVKFHHTDTLRVRVARILDAVDRNPELNDFKPELHKLSQFGGEVSVLLW